MLNILNAARLLSQGNRLTLSHNDPMIKMSCDFIIISLLYFCTPTMKPVSTSAKCILNNIRVKYSIGTKTTFITLNALMVKKTMVTVY